MNKSTSYTFSSGSKTKELILWAQNNVRAICAFNFSTIDVASAILKRAGELASPVILETSPREAAFLTPQEAHSLITIYRPQYNFSLHLDHGNTEAIINECIKAEYDSVHIDIKEETCQETIEKINLMTLYCHAHNIAVEAGVGSIPESSTIFKKNSGLSDLTDPEKAAFFAQETGIDFLLVSIGETHGITPNEKLDLSLLAEIHRRVSLPLVLHGGSGISKEDLQNAIRLGVCKINFNTELRLAWVKGIKQAFKDNPSEIVPYKILPKAHNLIKKVVEEKIKICTTASL